MDMENCKKQIQDAFDKEANRERLILCCSCFNMEKKARQAFSLLFPNEISPNVIKGRDRIYKFSLEKNSPHIKAISKLSGKFAYYVELEDGKVVKEYNLVTGARTA